MQLNRRSFLKASAAVPLSFGISRIGNAHAAFTPKAGAWADFEITTRVQVEKPAGVTQAWVPVPSVNQPDWFKSLDSAWTSNGSASLQRDATSGAEFVHVTWAEGEAAPVMEVVSRISTRGRAAVFGGAGTAPALSDEERALYTAGTELIPVNGIVKETADRITAGMTHDIDKARVIYEWVVDNTYRDAKTRGCGVGDVAMMLETGKLYGKCADLNALYVGLARASGLPARDIYGIRVAPSAFGYQCLGANSPTVTKSQHCRAETYLSGLGWIATDPADVLKVALEEGPGNLPKTDPKVVDARSALFGSWEGNWLAYNFAHDVVLPGSQGPKLGFLMYPQVECGPNRLDCVDPDTVKYSITARALG